MSEITCDDYCSSLFYVCDYVGPVFFFLNCSVESLNSWVLWLLLYVTERTYPFFIFVYVLPVCLQDDYVYPLLCSLSSLAEKVTPSRFSWTKPHPLQTNPDYLWNVYQWIRVSDTDNSVQWACRWAVVGVVHLLKTLQYVLPWILKNTIKRELPLLSRLAREHAYVLEAETAPCCVWKPPPFSSSVFDEGGGCPYRDSRGCIPRDSYCWWTTLDKARWEEDKYIVVLWLWCIIVRTGLARSQTLG